MTKPSFMCRADRVVVRHAPGYSPPTALMPDTASHDDTGHREGARPAAILPASRASAPGTGPGRGRGALRLPDGTSRARGADRRGGGARRAAGDGAGQRPLRCRGGPPIRGEREARGGGDHPSGQRELRDRHAAPHRDPALAAERHPGRPVPAQHDRRRVRAQPLAAPHRALVGGVVGHLRAAHLLHHLRRVEQRGRRLSAAPQLRHPQRAARFPRALPDLLARPGRGQQVRHRDTCRCGWR